MSLFIIRHADPNPLKSVVHCAPSTNIVGLSSLSEITLQEPRDPEESEALTFSSSTPQQISSPVVSLVHDGFTDIANCSTPSRTVLPSCSATTPQGKFMVQSTAPGPNSGISTDINGRLRDLPEPLPDQVTPTRATNRTPYSSTPSKGASLKLQWNTAEDSDLPSTFRTTSSPFPPADSSLTSWSSKDDPSDFTKSLPLGSSSSLESSQRFRFSSTSSNSHPPPDSHIPSSRKPSIAMRRGTSGQYNRRRPHIYEKVVSIWAVNVSTLFSLSPVQSQRAKTAPRNARGIEEGI